MLYVLCGISSAGKTTILKAVLQRDPSLGRLITYTTRSPRPNEVKHVDYHFVSIEDFQMAVQAGQLVCPIYHRGQGYATARRDLRACDAGVSLAVLRPDKISELQQYVFAPIISMYITRPGLGLPETEDDYISAAHQHLCTYQVTNYELDLAVSQVLDIIHTGDVQ